jgi:hypothetical protein
MPILPKGNPQRVPGKVCGKDLAKSERQVLESRADFYSVTGQSVGSFLLNSRPPTIVFGWEVEGIDPANLHDSLALDS